MTLEEEEARATELLQGCVVKRVLRHRAEEVVIEFEGGIYLLVDSVGRLELSITADEDG